MEYRKGHMALVSDDPGGQSGAIGVITLEDVIEELIGEVRKIVNILVIPWYLYNDDRKSLMRLMSILMVRNMVASKEFGILMCDCIVANKVRVVRRQVTNSRKSNARLHSRWRKRHSQPGPIKESIVRSMSSHSVSNHNKVVEPYQKTYGAITHGVFSTSPSNGTTQQQQQQERHPLLTGSPK